MPELQEEDGALGLHCLDHWLPGIDLLLGVDSGCVGVPGQKFRLAYRNKNNHAEQKQRVEKTRVPR